MKRDMALYTPAGIAVGTLLGSLAAGTVLLWINYRSLGHAGLANKVAAAGMTLYLVILAAASVLPNEPLLAVVFISLQTALAYWAASTLQGEAVRFHLQHGARPHSMLRAGAIGFLAGLSVVLVLLILLAVLDLAPVATAAQARR